MLHRVRICFAQASIYGSSHTSPFTAFDRLKEPPKSATLTHLDEWLSRLIWLQSLGSMEPLVNDLRPAKIIHLAEIARSLYPSDLLDFTPPKRFALLSCLIFQAVVSTRDEIVQMFLKRMRTLTDKAQQELERLRQAERAITEHLVEVFAEVVRASADAKGPTAVVQRSARFSTEKEEPSTSWSNATR